MNNISKTVELIILLKPDGNISVTGPIHNFELCMDMISTAIKLLLAQNIKSKAENENGVILPKNRFVI